MPRISEYSPQVDIQQPATPQVQMENFTGGWKNATEAFGTLDKVVGEFKKVRDFNEQADATLGFQEEVDGIKAQAANEQDPTKAAEYRAKIDEAIAKHSAKISDKLLQKETTVKFQLAGYNTFAAINNDFRNKEIDNGQAKFLILADKYARSYSEASDDTSRRVIRESYSDMLNSAQRSGLFSAEDVARKRIIQDKEFDKADLAYDIQNIPEQVANRKAAGHYKNLTPAEVDEGLRLAQSMKERIEKQIERANKEAQINNEIDVISSAAKGMVYSIDDITKMVGSGEIRQDVGKAYIKYVTSPASINPVMDDTGYSKMVEGIFRAGNKDAMVTAIKDTLDGGADGKMKQEDLQNLIAIANKRAQSLYDIKEDGLKPGSEQSEIDALYKYIIGWASTVKLDDKQKAALTSEWVDSIVKEGEKSARQATDTVIKKAIVDKHPSVIGLPDVPNVIVTKEGMTNVFNKKSNAGGKKAVKTPVVEGASVVNISFDDL